MPTAARQTFAFRGRHNGIYNFLSAPGFAVNVKTEQAVFTIHEGALTINGTFLTEAHVVAEMSHQRLGGNTDFVPKEGIFLSFISPIFLVESGDISRNFFAH